MSPRMSCLVQKYVAFLHWLQPKGQTPGHDFHSPSRQAWCWQALPASVTSRFHTGQPGGLQKVPGSLYFHTFIHVTSCTKNYLSSLSNLPQVPTKSGLSSKAWLGGSLSWELLATPQSSSDSSLRAPHESLSFAAAPLRAVFSLKQKLNPPTACLETHDIITLCSNQKANMGFSSLASWLGFIYVLQKTIFKCTADVTTSLCKPS